MGPFTPYFYGFRELACVGLILTRFCFFSLFVANSFSATNYFFCVCIMAIPYANRTAVATFAALSLKDKPTFDLAEVQQEFAKVILTPLKDSFSCIQYLNRSQVRLTFLEARHMEEVMTVGLLFRGHPVQLQPTHSKKWVTVSRLPFGIPTAAVEQALRQFGPVTSVKLQYTGGICNGNFSVLMDVRFPVPSKLVINRHVCFTWYRGQVRTCFKCGASGHQANACPGQKNPTTNGTSWADRVAGAPVTHAPMVTDDPGLDDVPVTLDNQETTTVAATTTVLLDATVPVVDGNVVVDLPSDPPEWEVAPPPAKRCKAGTDEILPVVEDGLSTLMVVSSIVEDIPSTGVDVSVTRSLDDGSLPPERGIPGAVLLPDNESSDVGASFARVDIPHPKGSLFDVNQPPPVDDVPLSFEEGLSSPCFAAIINPLGEARGDSLPPKAHDTTDDESTISDDTSSVLSDSLDSGDGKLTIDLEENTPLVTINPSSDLFETSFREDPISELDTDVRDRSPIHSPKSSTAVSPLTADGCRKPTRPQKVTSNRRGPDRGICLSFSPLVNLPDSDIPDGQGILNEDGYLVNLSNTPPTRTIPNRPPFEFSNV